MPKATKETILRRIRDLERLIIAGGSFADAAQYANAHEWQVGSRQLRRYLKKAYARLAKVTEQDRKELLGQHVMQRRAILMRCNKVDDRNGALRVLKDEAHLLGLYANSKGTRTTTGRPDEGRAATSLPRSERAVRLTESERRGDAAEVQLLEAAMPSLCYSVPDTLVLQGFLYILCQTYVIEQLEQASIFYRANYQAMRNGDPCGGWRLISQISAYRFCIGVEAWRQFTQGIKVDGDYLVCQNSSGGHLETHQQTIGELAPTVEQLTSEFAKAGKASPQLQIPEDVARHWHRLLAKFNGN